MTAGKGNPRFLASKTAAVNNALRHACGQFVNREAKHRNRHDRFAAHSENVAHGVSRRNASKIERIIDNRHEKVCGTDDRRTIA